jgi:hypothetical protein
MIDETEQYRRARVGEVNCGLDPHPSDRRVQLEELYGKVWDTTELGQDFKVLGFMAPFVVVQEKATGKKGTLEFCHSPRFYFNFQHNE